MIVDSIDRIERYAAVLPYAEEIGKLFALGTTQGASCEIRVKSYQTKPDAVRRFEVHNHTIDLMIGISGREIIHICPPEELTPAEPLPGGEDGQKLDGSPRGHAVLLQAGYFIAIYPGEAHMVGGQVIPGEPEPLEKWVVKVPLIP